jgi:hypothetical protein
MFETNVKIVFWDDWIFNNSMARNSLKFMNLKAAEAALVKMLKNEPSVT